MVGATNAISRSFYAKLNFDFLRDIEPIGSFLRVPLVMLVHPSVSLPNTLEFIAYAKANPGKLNMASLATGARPRRR